MRHLDVWRDHGRAWRRNAGVLLSDVSFRRNLRFLGTVCLVSFACFGLLWYLGVGIKAEVYQQDGGRHALTFAEYVFCVLGAIDADPGTAPVYTLYSAFVRLTGAILIGGVLTSFLCTLLERFSDMTVRGLLVPAMHDHTVIVGYSPLTDDLIRKVLDDSPDALHLDAWYPYYKADRRARKTSRVLLYTSGDVEKIREILGSVLDKDAARRVTYAFGDMDMSQPARAKETCRKLCLLNARKVFVLGDESDPIGGDLKNWAFADVAGSFVQRHSKQPRTPSPSAVPLPIYVQMDDLPSFDLMKRMDFNLGAVVKNGEKSLGAVRAYIRPYSYAESWARTLWGMPFRIGPWEPLDFRPMGEGDYVHLVIVGLNPKGASLLNEAVRVCHYSRGEKTRITIIDKEPSVETVFRSLHPELFDLLDLTVSFRHELIQSESARQFLVAETANPHCLLTVAFCTDCTERTIQMATTLPEEVYRAYEDQSGKPEKRRISQRETYTRHPPRILVYQEHLTGGKQEEAKQIQIRYRTLYPFGMQEAGFNAHCLRGFAAMYLNAVYFWPRDADGTSTLDAFKNKAIARKYPDLAKAALEFASEWETFINGERTSEIPIERRYDFLKKMLGQADSLLLAFKQYAFRRFVLMPPEKSWANVYVPDSFGTVLRSLGLRAELVANFDGSSAKDFRELCDDNDDLFSEALNAEGVRENLSRAEHNRWMADRALMGYRRNRPEEGESRDDGYRYHDSMIPYDELAQSEKNKDMTSIHYIPFFLALDGLSLIKGVVAKSCRRGVSPRREKDENSSNLTRQDAASTGRGSFANFPKES